ncbi:MAG: transcription-repair coupling factor, partial [Deltaproteobacteria bacterium]|nr:transcription-repair coupling factor [Deltaproteobacteria bacterium]
LGARLDLAGYTRNDPVEDPGSFTVRGSLFDVFSSASRRPFRLDFFDDELETVRTYDPLSQRSDPEALQSATIVPVTEWAFTPEALVIARQQIKAFCDEYGVPKKSRDAFVERLDAGIRDPSLEYLAPYFTGTTGGWLLDYLDESWQLALSDVLGVEASYEELVGELRDGFGRAVSEGEIVVPWERLYVEPEDFTRAVKQSVRVQFDDVLLGAAEDAAGRRRVESETNSDLKPNDTGKVSFEVIQALTRDWAERGYVRVFAASTSSQAERLSYLLTQREIPCRVVERIDWKETGVAQITEGQISAGFRLPGERVAIVTDAEIFGPKKPRARGQKSQQPAANVASFVPSLEDLNADELIVHNHHGIGRYRGLLKLAIENVPHDFLLIEYAGADKLYLPVYRLDQVQRYIGAQDGVALDKLGSNHFEKTKEKIKSDLQDMANQLLQLYAKRASREGFTFSPPDEAYREFEARFPYAETPDQLRAIDDVGADMSSGKIMDRLICGDVGYGKTEVAMRAAFRAVMDGKQVAVLVPTTVLAFQHERSFRERFKDAPHVNIGVLSRFKSPKEIKETLAGLKAGTIDIAIGTHRLLSKDVAFRDLGLIVVDEEQRFGVEHKERLKALRANVDALTLTATPIPRTLQFSLMGIRDISVINTAPVDRLSVRTYVSRFDDDAIRKAIEQEIGRGGQVFFIHNRVQSITAMADKLKEIVPEARIIVAHGQLGEGELEARMLDFYNKKGNVLLCSTIIESGLDIASANTMIINRADTFGLSQLYQLRGRVGRSQVRAYCYLMLPEEGAVTDDAKKRLDVIQRFVDLGSGFKIASHDLELRGGGEFLGKSQSGHIAAVGFELYSELLDEAVRELRGQAIEDHFDPEIKIPVPALLPETYVPDVHQRLGLYKRLSQAATPEALHELELELQDRFGKPTYEVQNLLWLIQIKQLLRQFRIRSLVSGRERTAIDASDGAKLSPAKTLALVNRQPQTYSITPDSKIVLRLPFQTAQQMFHELQKLLTQVAEI